MPTIACVCGISLARTHRTGIRWLHLKLTLRHLPARAQAGSSNGVRPWALAAGLAVLEPLQIVDLVFDPGRHSSSSSSSFVLARRLCSLSLSAQPGCAPWAPTHQTAPISTKSIVEASVVARPRGLKRCSCGQPAKLFDLLAARRLEPSGPPSSRPPTACVHIRRPPARQRPRPPKRQASHPQ